MPEGTPWSLIKARNAKLNSYIIARHPLFYPCIVRAQRLAWLIFWHYANYVTLNTGAKTPTQQYHSLADKCKHSQCSRFLCIMRQAYQAALSACRLLSINNHKLRSPHGRRVYSLTANCKHSNGKPHPGINPPHLSASTIDSKDTTPHLYCHKPPPLSMKGKVTCSSVYFVL